METAKEPLGFGGWLWLPGILIFITPWHLGESFNNKFLPVVVDTWTYRTDANSVGYVPLYTPLIVLWLVMFAAIMVSSFWLLWLLHKKSKSVPKFAILWMIASIALTFMSAIVTRYTSVHDATLPQALPYPWEEVKTLATQAIWGALWIGYFTKSKRVKNTFVEPISNPG